MTTTEDSLSTTTLDASVRESTRQAIVDFFQRCGLQYVSYVRDETWYAECCQEAVNRSIPLDGKYSFRKFMDVGVAITATAFAHIPDRPTKMWVSLLISVSIGIDDHLGGALDMEHLYHFNARFVSCQSQGHPATNALDALLREAPRYYSPFMSNLITTSMLDFVSSLLLDHETKDMQISTKTPLFAYYCRCLSGFPTAAILFIFPPMLPVQEYIQSMPAYLRLHSAASPTPHPVFNAPPFNPPNLKMSILENLFGKKFNTPILRPMAPFFIAGVIVFYGINSFSKVLANTDEFKNDPRNPAAKKNIGH